MIVITALMVAMVLLSTAIFVIEAEKDVPTVGVDTSNVLSAYQQATRETLISVLSNVTNGGNPGVLTADLNELESVIVSKSYQSILEMSFTPLNELPYQNGILISWGTTGQGISSASITLGVNSSGTSLTSNLSSEVNITSEVDLVGSYLQLASNLTQVNLNVNVLNEGGPALAQNLAFFFDNATEGWAEVYSPTICDFGNGTYTASFTTETSQWAGPFLVSVRCEDQRGILIVANATCTNGQ